MKVYKYSEEASDWLQIGGTIRRDAIIYTKALSEEGNVLTLREGNTQVVYELKKNSKIWNKRGKKFEVESLEAFLSSNGSLLAFWDDCSVFCVRVYIWKDNTWQQRGEDMITACCSERFRLDSNWREMSIQSLNDDATVFAFSKNANEFTIGFVAVFQWRWEINCLSQIGTDAALNAVPNTETQLIYSTSLSKDGKRLAVGATFYDSFDVNEDNPTTVDVFELKNFGYGPKWSQIGETVSDPGKKMIFSVISTTISGLPVMVTSFFN